MRTLVRFSLDTAASNAAIRNGTLQKLIATAQQELEPEAAYFFADGGKRTASFVFDLKNPTDIPSIAEPWFMGTNASVEFFPVMNADNLKAGLEKAARNM